MSIQVCSTCEVEKDIAEFHLEDGRYRRQCKTCRRHKRLDREANWSDEQIERDRRSSLKSSWKIQGIDPSFSLENYDQLVELQSNRCAICKASPPEDQRLYVDHDHASGAVRGLLCNNCNFGIGSLKDDPAILANALSYILNGGVNVQDR